MIAFAPAIMANRKNVLVLSAGRRVSLARAFRRVCKEQGAELYTGDMNTELSSACQDNGLSVRTPHAGKANYSAALARICEDHAIGLVVPTIDTELLILSTLREQFHAMGTTIVVSSPEIIAMANDKRKTADFFSAYGVQSPRIYDLQSPHFPAIAKPFDGSLSRDVHVLRAEEDYTGPIRALPNLMLAQYIDPDEHEEFTCDAYYDRNGHLRCIVPRKRIEVRGGEVSKGRTIRNNIIDLFQSHLSTIEGALGCLTFQFFRNRNTGELFLIELNARFGGGFPLTLASGADYPQWLYDEYIVRKDVPDFDNWEANMTMLRFDEAVFIPGKVDG